MMTTVEALPAMETETPPAAELRAAVAEIGDRYYGQLDADPNVRLPFRPLELRIPGVPDGYDVVVLDCEDLPSGAFKYLGASVAIGEAQRKAAETGTALTHVIAASDGNHGMAVLEVARPRGLAASIYMPSFVDEERQRYFRDRNVALDNSFATFEEADAAAQAAGKQSGAAYIAPFDAEATMAGNGYLGHVVGRYVRDNGLAERYSSVTMFSATAGGGKNAGCTIALDNLGMGNVVKLRGAQLENCDAAARALDDRPALTAAELDTSCISTALLQAGNKPLAILRDSLADPDSTFEGIEGLSRRDVAETMLVYEYTYGRTEPAAALALAGAIKRMRAQDAPQDGQRHLMLVVRCGGGNVTEAIYQDYVSEVSDEFKLALKESLAASHQPDPRRKAAANQCAALGDMLLA